jgi:phospholipid transport system substrate-binding protein
VRGVVTPGRLASLIVAGSLCLSLTAAVPGWAGPATETIQHVITAANRILTDPRTDDRPFEKIAAIQRLVNEIVDWPAAAAHALGPEWALRTPAEQEEFTQLFADLAERTFVMGVASRARITGGLQVAWLSERVNVDRAVVTTMMSGRNGSELPVEYRMARVNGNWRIRDLVLDGVSLVENYRAQVQAVLRRSSYGDLVAAMRSRAPDVVAMLARAGSRARVAAAEPLAIAPAPDTTPPVAVAAPAAMPAAPSRPAAVAAAAVPTVGASAAVEAVAPTPPAAVVPAALKMPATAEVLRPAVPASRPRGREEISATLRPTPVGSFGAVGKRGYWVQVGAFQSVETAARLADRLRSWAFTIAVGPFARTPDPTPLTRVLVGPFAERQQATAVLGRLHAKGVTGFVTADR